jgi:acetylornithine deacetylase/succinyl-diaminopimelate desuccinylase-like protein
MSIMPEGLSVIVFERGTGGVPSTTLIDNLSGRIESYEQTIAATFGFESMRCTLTATADDAIDMLGNWLMRSTIVFSPDAEIVWEGFLETIEAQFGQVRLSVSLAPMANRIKARYVTVNGVAGVSSTMNDTASQALYGVKDAVLSIGTATSGEADDEATVRLAEVKNPRMTPSCDVQTGDLGPVQVTLHFTGWYATLEWLTTSNSTTSTAVTTTQVGTLLTTAAATNAFIATSTANIVASDYKSVPIAIGITN